jgi:hypothetical protein
MFKSHHFQRHYQNCESASTPQSGRSHKTCLRRFGGNGSVAWTSAVSHVGRTSNAFKVTVKLQTLLFQMVVTSCISVQDLWKCGFAKSSDNLYTPCIYLLTDISLNSFHVLPAVLLQKRSQFCDVWTHACWILVTMDKSYRPILIDISFNSFQVLSAGVTPKTISVLRHLDTCMLNLGNHW